MFKFSFDWLTDYIGKDIQFKEVLRILNLQGFEFQGEQKAENDVVTAIEVKANRPDMLSHMGIAREIQAFCNKKIPNPEKVSLKTDNTDFSVKINVEDKKICHRFIAIKINDIDNTVSTPEYIKRRLQALGINLVNAVVDITNYVMLDMGQPMHSYDVESLCGAELNISKANTESEIVTFSGASACIKPGDIVISDKENILCVAGIIGTALAQVTKQSKSILLEGALFDEVSVRLTSRRLKISTPSSFRFERGVSGEYTLDILSKCAQMIVNICGGTIESQVFDFCPKSNEDKFLNLSVQNTNKLLGTNFDKKTVIDYLEKYNFKCLSKDENTIRVQIPPYRLDVLKEVDLIEEVARIHGYDNIKAIMPTIKAHYSKNGTWSKMDDLRSVLTGFGFFETVNYSFIPFDTMKTLGIEKNDRLYSDLTLQNPIAGAYSLMRPTLVISLLNCLAYNYSRGNTDLGIFEIGKVFFKDNGYDTGCREVPTCAFMISGKRTFRGWGSDKDIKYTYYDLLNYLKIIMGNFGQSFELKTNNYKFCEESTGYDIVLNGNIIGFIGELNKSVIGKIQNVKLIKDKIFYCEFYFENITQRVKKIEFESKYPPVRRLYNFVQKKNVTAKEVINLVKSAGSIIRSVIVKDVYSDKSFAQDEHAVLYEVNYCSKTSTLTSEEIERIESEFLKALNDKLGICLKD